MFAPLSWIWGVGSFCKNWLYDQRLVSITRVSRPVVSVGNLVAGGVGKTPLVHLLASQFPHRKVAILSRGYGKIPDEARLFQRRLPQATVYVGKNRIDLAKQAVKEGADLLILDDGLQHRKLHRDFELIVLSGADPFGKGHYLPWGFLRDSPERLKEADAIFIRGKESFPIPHISLQTKVDRILDLDQHPISSIQDWPVALFCGIGNPKRFKKTVEDQGAKVVAEWILADHEPVSFSGLIAYAEKAKSLGARAILCTEKDFVKIDPKNRLSLPLLFLEISFIVSDGMSLWQNLIAKIDQKIDNATTYE